MAEREAAIAALTRDGALPEGFHVEQQELGSPALMLAGLLDGTLIHRPAWTPGYEAALILLALPALFTWIGRSSFERRRWEDSDFPKGES